MKYNFNSKIHAHTLDDRPLLGTSSVVGIIAKPLTWWASGLAVAKFGWVNPKNNPPEAVELALDEGYKQVMALDKPNYKKLLAEAYKAHSVKLDTSADAGTDMHAELEKYVKLMIDDQDGTPMLKNGYEHKAVEIFAEWAVKNVEKFLWSELHTYSERLWVGGITDCGALLKDGKIAIIDFKSSKEAYQSQFIQIAGYDLELSETGGYTAKGEKMFTLESPISAYVVFPFGAKNPEPAFRYNTEELRKGFESALVLYKLNQ
jgi:hypothetical protein